MERVKTLADKLNDQLAQHAPVSNLLMTVQMLQSELTHLQSNEKDASKAPGVALNIAATYHLPKTETVIAAAAQPTPEVTEAPVEEEKTVAILQIDEAEVEAELEEIKRNAEERNKISAQNKPVLSFDPVEDIPTLTHQQTEPEPLRTDIPTFEEAKELHQRIATGNKASLNDKLKQIKIELSDTLTDAPIKDLRKAIGINDRFLFIRELFREDETMYERSIKTINGFSIYPEAEYWIKRELKLKLAWDDKNETVKQFDQLVRRRFS